MTISFSGLVSGLDTSSWVEALVSVKQEKVNALQVDLKAIQTKKSTLTDTRSAFTALRSALEKLTDTKFGGAFDLFGQNTATSSNTDIFTATAGEGALRQNYDIAVKQLATFTKAVSKESASAVADDETKLSNLGIKEGSLTVYVDGVKTDINIEKDDTLGDLKAQFAAAGINTEVDEKGFLKLSANDTTKDVNIGSTTDTTNFTSVFGLEKQEDGAYVSTNALFKASTASVLVGEGSGFSEEITKGTFKIGDAEFTITDKTTLSSLISDINNNDKAQAYAFWDDATGKLNITSTKEGASYINIEAGSSNFTDVMGFTETERDADNNIVKSKMFTDTQELGKNALFTVNGTEMTSTSNVVSSDISRIAGVTLTLKKVSTEEDGNTTLKVNQDTTGLVDAVKAFVTAYNDTIDKIDTVTASGADLQRDSSLRSFKNTMISYANGSNTSNGGVYKLLSEIGISTAKADKNNLSTDTYKLELDETKLLKALEENPDSVEAMLGGETGVLALMEGSVEQMLSATTGYFDIQTGTMDADIKKMQEKITKQQSKITSYRAQLENKFYKMEQAIAQMQQNYSSFTG